MLLSNQAQILTIFFQRVRAWQIGSSTQGSVLCSGASDINIIPNILKHSLLQKK
jgi:hypothetical protein